MVTRNQKTIIHTEKRESNPNITLKIVELYQITREESKIKRKKKRSTKQPENNKQNGNNYMPIVTLNVNGINTSIRSIQCLN